MTLSFEQSTIVGTSNENMVIQASAGTGKTTVLYEYTKSRPFEIFLYLAYSSSIRDEAYKKFGGNTVTHTIHSLAYEALGHYYEEKLTNNIKIFDIINGVPEFKEQNKSSADKSELYIQANRVLSLLTTFFNSKFKKLTAFGFDALTLDYAIYYFEAMQDLTNFEVKMTHDGYLKLYQMSNPVLKFDYILIDEAQDSNEVMLDIISSQDTYKIFVGDQFQSIFAFRNIVNIFERNDIGMKFFLTESFRYGENIAGVANKLLGYYKTTFKDIIGLNPQDSIVGIPYNEQYTHITRTNSYLFDLAAISALSGLKIHIIGSEKFLFNEMLDAMHLFNGDIYKIKSKNIRDLKSFNNLRKIVEDTMDPELTFLYKITEKYGAEIEALIGMIKLQLVGKRNADIIYTTVHKSKGLEFFNVKLGEDFYPLFSKAGLLVSPLRIEQEEVNIYYVAITRAINYLELNDEMIKFLRNVPI